MKVVVGLASLVLAAVAAAAGIFMERKRQHDLKMCDCGDGECCNSVRPSERRYQLPRAHVEHWDTRNGECDPSWSKMAPGGPADTTGDQPRTSFGTLILLRHGQSVWNRKPDRPTDLWRYAGSIDIPLSAVGMQEAYEAGKRLDKKTPVVEHHSPLDKPSFDGVNDKNPYDFIIPVYVSPTLNERNFGDLQGVPSTKHTVLFNREHVKKIRNDYYTRFPGENGESCEDIHNRTIPFFNSFILPHLAAGRNVLVSSHGFVIRTLIKYLDRMDAQAFNEQMKLEKTAPDKCLLLAPTGVPLMYKYENGNFTKLAQTRRDRAESLSRSIAPY
ncbi:hypothetical protein PF005_g1070 [Phytophthora fragariae]|uniref:phosphoglycerate mutase (2,3-diphosphoglycerate-dependent) n=1 Tax=Phytophthora fragariae TaxID=53985 RepID=A0A6A3ZJN1_9STRA|nr:hypothetical protein PF007_g935 [Phytophthora fragariae]KAE9236456.1 hypothetical protein PF005_g1070 [Phytophthora fragariae]KAE9254888.1 hypothetical protein PF004_g813 [Phytophthora fragariae]